MISIVDLVGSLFDALAARISELPEPLIILLTIFMMIVLFFEILAIRAAIRFYRWTCRDDDEEDEENEDDEED